LLPPVLYLLDKALITVEGNGRRLSPEFDIVEQMKPFVKRLLSERLSIRKLRKDLYTASLDWEAVLRELPDNTRNIINKIKQGKIRIEFYYLWHRPFFLGNRVFTYCSLRYPAQVARNSYHRDCGVLVRRSNGFLVIDFYYAPREDVTGESMLHFRLNKEPREDWLDVPFVDILYSPSRSAL